MILFPPTKGNSNLRVRIKTIEITKRLSGEAE